MEPASVDTMVTSGFVAWKLFLLASVVCLGYSSLMSFLMYCCLPARTSDTRTLMIRSGQTRTLVPLGKGSYEVETALNKEPAQI